MIKYSYILLFLVKNYNRLACLGIIIIHFYWTHRLGRFCKAIWVLNMRTRHDIASKPEFIFILLVRMGRTDSRKVLFSWAWRWIHTVQCISVLASEVEEVQRDASVAYKRQTLLHKALSIIYEAHFNSAFLLFSPFSKCTFIWAMKLSLRLTACSIADSKIFT